MSPKRPCACCWSLLIGLLGLLAVLPCPALARGSLGGALSLGVMASEKEALQVQPRAEVRYRLREDLFRFDAAARLQGIYVSHRWTLDATLDRLSVKLYLPAYDVSLGRQPLQWGRQHPFGLANPFAPLKPTGPNQDAPPVDALAVTVHTADLAFLEIAGGRVSGEDTQRIAARYRTNTGHGDVGAFAVLMKGGGAYHSAVGGEWHGDVGPLGAGIEVRQDLSGSGAKGLQLSATIDGSWSGRHAWQIGYLSVPAANTGPGRHMLQVATNLVVTELAGAAFSALTNLENGVSSYSALASFQLGRGYATRLGATAGYGVPAAARAELSYSF